MPILESDDGFKVDYSDEGSGEPVILVHSSSIGNRQWRRLMEELKSERRLLAVNLLGYGQTTAWHEDGTQTWTDQARVVQAVSNTLDGPVDLVGHSFGGAVAMKAATLLGSKVRWLILFEPNPFPLLREAGRADAYAETLAVQRMVKTLGARGEWMQLAERFVEYWNGDGAWAQIPAERRASFAHALRPNYFEWDTMDNEKLPIAQWPLPDRTLLMWTPGTRRAIAELCDVLAQLHPAWTAMRLPEGGHMAPLTHPQLVNPLIGAFLRA